MQHQEHHLQHRVGWLRASVLGANDGIVSTASLIIGVAAANSGYTAIVVAGTAGLVAGAISMAAGEYVSVSSQADMESSDLRLEKKAIESDFAAEASELAEIYQQRGVAPELSMEVARQLMAYDALGAHARDEIGISEQSQAQPLTAALSSALSFTVGALLPLCTAYFYRAESLPYVVALFSLIFLAILGAISSYLGGTRIHIGITRVTFWGALAMIATAFIGIALDVAA
jgi:VIT1/CCC1 family predicted Fe2+/Mn2+ transporter